MNNEAIVALISGLCVAVPTIITTVITTVSSNKTNNRLIDERLKYMGEQIQNLTSKVEKHNEFNDRLIIVEEAVKRLDHKKGV